MLRAMSADGFDDLLEGLEGEARTARERLLRRLADDGVSREELRRAVEEERLVLLPVDRALSPEPKFTRHDLAERTGLTVDELRQARRSLGLPVGGDDAKIYGDEDLEALGGLRQLLDAGVAMEQVVDLNRVIGRATSQIAAASRQAVGDAILSAGVTEEEAAGALASAARQLTPLMRNVLAYSYEGHLRELLRSDAVSSADIAAGRTAGARDMTVAFADIVGFTKLGERVAAEELGDVAGQLERVAAGVVEKPVTLVKTVGDAVMLVAPKPDPLLGTLLELLDAMDGDDGLQLRVGVACGPALERAGDWYGSPVNQASRVTGVARPGSVLTTQSVRDHADDDWTWSYARERKLKGVGEVKLYRVRRPSDGDGR